MLSFLQLLVLLFFFWTPMGRGLLMYSYTESFMLRFPLLYIAFWCIGLLFEVIREATQKELENARNRFERLYRQDALTGLYNRYGFNEELDKLLESRKDSLAFAIVDLDHFKNINDTYGHSQGDIVLR